MLSRFRGPGLKIPKSCYLVLAQNFLKIFDLVTFDHVGFDLNKRYVLRVCTYRSNKKEWGTNQIPSLFSQKETEQKFQNYSNILTI